MDCRRTVTIVATGTSLTRDRWYGLETLASDYSEGRNKTRSGDAHPHWKCVGTDSSTKYRGFSSHSSLENGRRYTAQTSNWQHPGLSQFGC
jgi:hypothetical protein